MRESNILMLCCTASCCKYIVVLLRKLKRNEELKGTIKASTSYIAVGTLYVGHKITLRKRVEAEGRLIGIQYDNL